MYTAEPLSLSILMFCKHTTRVSKTMHNLFVFTEKCTSYSSANGIWLHLWNKTKNGGTDRKSRLREKTSYDRKIRAWEAFQNSGVFFSPSRTFSTIFIEWSIFRNGSAMLAIQCYAGFMRSKHSIPYGGELRKAWHGGRYNTGLSVFRSELCLLL